MKKITNISFGLFENHWYSFKRNMKDFFIFLGRIPYTLKHGFTPVATWETDSYFIQMMLDIMKDYRYNRHGSGFMYDPTVETEEEAAKFLTPDQYRPRADKIFDELISCLEIMNIGRWEDGYNEEEHEKAKKKFFRIFSANFETFWD